MSIISDDTPVSRNDLSLLLKSYENSITLNTTLLSQQKQLVEKQNQLLQDFHDCTTAERLVENRASCQTEHREVQDIIKQKYHRLTVRFLLMFGSIVGTLVSILVMIILKLLK